MRSTLAILICGLLAPSAFAQPVVFPDNTTSDQPGGLIIIRKGNQTTWALGGAFLPQSVKVVTRTPDGGKDIVRFHMPSVFQNPYAPPLSTVVPPPGGIAPLPGGVVPPAEWKGPPPVPAAPAAVQVTVPDPHALLFVDGELVRTRGTTRQLESPALPPGKTYPLRVRAAYVVGNNFVIEDREVLIRAGENASVTFDGARALVVPLPKNDAQVAQTPANK
jgi:uncharacterized protein (TIGR03000 family)